MPIKLLQLLTYRYDSFVDCAAFSIVVLSTLTHFTLKTEHKRLIIAAETLPCRSAGCSQMPDLPREVWCML